MATHQQTSDSSKPSGSASDADDTRRTASAASTDRAALTADQLAAFGRTLDAREKELQAEVREATTEEDRDDKPPLSEVGDEGDVGEQRIREAVRYAEKERDIAELQQIDAARARIADGSYGDCSDCGIDIPLARLEVQPTASRCIPCQEAYERTHRTGPAIAPALSEPGPAG